MTESDALRIDLCQALGVSPSRTSLMRIGGGDSHHAARLECDGERWFVKWNAASRRGLFDEELDALAALTVKGGPVLPSGIASGSNDAQAWLVTEWLDLHPRGDAREFGRRLATLHRQTRPRFGWHTSNHLGASRQDNRPGASWSEFWWSRRLAPQLERALANGMTLQTGLRTIEDASKQLLNHDPLPALVHGDLWGGNHAYLADGSPVIFDPAPYYGDRETDLAMMRLFGGFAEPAFEAYTVAWPLPPGADGRVDLYQLYHLVNHFNLFGPGWESRATRALDAVLQIAEGS